MYLETQQILEAAIWLVYNLYDYKDETSLQKIPKTLKELAKRLDLDEKSYFELSISVLALLRTPSICWEVEVQEKLRKDFLRCDEGQKFSGEMFKIMESFEKKPNKEFGN